MSKFKVGDKVRRTGKQGNFTKGIKTLEIGETDIVVGVNGAWLKLKNSCPNEDNAHSNSFELVEDTKFKVGDVVECISTRYSDVNKGATYNVLKVFDDGIRVNARDNNPHRYKIKHFKLVSPKEELIETDMDIEDIKNFPKAVLVKAEKEAKKELANEQEKMAVAEFKRLFARIADKERELSRVQSELKDLRGEAKITNK